eukprot:scaffold35906_cov13-Tisochrysis_lutea.AAC.1
MLARLVHRQDRKGRSHAIIGVCEAWMVHWLWTGRGLREQAPLEQHAEFAMAFVVLQQGRRHRW